MSEIEYFTKPRPIKSWKKLTDKIIVQKYMHPMYESWVKLIRHKVPENLACYNTPTMGKWHYIYRSEKGRISLVSLPNYFHNGIDLWEICGAMTPDGDIERFGSKEEAEDRIKELLE